MRKASHFFSPTALRCFFPEAPYRKNRASKKKAKQNCSPPTPRHNPKVPAVGVRVPRRTPAWYTRADTGGEPQRRWLDPGPGKVHRSHASASLAIWNPLWPSSGLAASTVPFPQTPGACGGTCPLLVHIRNRSTPLAGGSNAPNYRTVIKRRKINIVGLRLPQIELHPGSVLQAFKCTCLRGGGC